MGRIKALSFFVFIITSLHLFSQGEPLDLYKSRFQSELIPPATMKQTGNDSWIVDFGKDAFGTIKLSILVFKPDTLIIRLGEKLSAPGKIDRNPGGTIRYVSVRLPVMPALKDYTVQLPADKRNTSPPAVALPDSFGVVIPFRYCEIENFPGTLNSGNIRQKVFHYYFNDKTSYFNSSDTVLNRIWELCKYSIKATSFCGVYVDGDRERIPYEADAFINQLSHYCVDNEYSLARRTNEYFIRNPTWPTEWILHTVLLFYYDYLYTGDPQPLLKNYDALKVKTLIELEREDGLISSKSEKLTDDLMDRLGFKDNKQRIRDIVDWPPAQKDTGWKLVTSEGERDGYDMVPVNTVVNAFHYYNLKLMSEIAGWLGKKEDSAFFMNLAGKVKNTINKKLIDRENGTYTDGENSKHSSLHANMFPLAFGLVPDEYKERVISFIKSRGMACSVYGAQFLLDGLYLENEQEYAFDLLTSLSDRSWWNMIRAGSTVTMEAWDMKYKPNSDWNHAWGSAPANIITRQLWGIRPVEPGFAKAIIRPQLGRLTSSMIVVPTIKGEITGISASVNEKTDFYSIIIPAGMKADFVVTPGKYSNLVLNNKKTKFDGTTISLKEGKWDIELRK
jgi:alpha-L-rhamnosidase